jgi:type III pantothenate kinase
MSHKKTGREMKLLIDAGNTRIKWALVEGMTRRAQASGAGLPSSRLLPQSAVLASNESEADGEEWICRGELPTGLADKLSRFIAEQFAQLSPNASLHDIKQIWVSNVAGEDVSRNILEFGTGISAQSHFVVARESQCGVRNGYSRASQLGSDRWTALVSAWHIVKGKCLVVNSGTATTVDALSGQGEFIGGLILPGVELMRRSLVESTNQLKPMEGEYMPFPLNTADAIFSGAIQATCGAIERQYSLLDDDSVPLLLSGGTADILQQYFNRKPFKMPPRVVGDLVLRGLLVMAQELNGQ